MQEKDYNPIERMRHRDTDGDGVADYIDSNGYSKPNDRYRYKNISTDDYSKDRKIIHTMNYAHFFIAWVMRNIIKAGHQGRVCCLPRRITVKRLCSISHITHLI